MIKIHGTRFYHALLATFLWTGLAFAGATTDLPARRTDVEKALKKHGQETTAKLHEDVVDDLCQKTVDSYNFKKGFVYTAKSALNLGAELLLNKDNKSTDNPPPGYRIYNGHHLTEPEGYKKGLICGTRIVTN